MSTKQSSGLIGRLIRRSLLLIVTLALMAVTAAGLMINGILNSEGITLPAAGAYTADRQETEAPVPRAKFVTEIK